MEITPEIQAHFDGIFNKRFGELQAKGETKTQEAVLAVEAKYKEQIAGKETELAELKKNAGGDKGNNDDLTALKARLAALEAEKVKSDEQAREAQLLTAAAELDAINGKQVALLVSPSIKSEKGRLLVVNAEGQTRLDAKGQPMEVKEFMRDFLTANPHLVKAQGVPGAGSRLPAGINNAGTKKINRAEFEKIPVYQRAEFFKSGGTITD